MRTIKAVMMPHKKKSLNYYLRWVYSLLIFVKDLNLDFINTVQDQLLASRIGVSFNLDGMGPGKEKSKLRFHS